MKLVKTEIKAEIYGNEYTIKMPTYKQVDEYKIKLYSETEDKNVSNIMGDFLSPLGLPKDVFDQLEISHVAQIMDMVLDSKKK